MDAILRAAALYLVLLVIFRLTGKRTLAQVTTFDFVLLLILSEATQQALLGNDFSITMSVLVVITLVGLDRLADFVGWRFPRVNRLLEGTPTVLVARGQPLPERMKQHLVTIEDVLEQARSTQGIRRADEIDYAILERSGSISIIRKSG